MLIIKSSNSPSNYKKIKDSLQEYNKAHSPYLKDNSSYGKSINFYAEIDGKMVGGTLCEIIYNWVYVEYLFVDERMRGQDIGTKILEKIEEYAKENNLTGMYTETFDFQARPFYEKYGFKVVGCYENMPPNSKLWLLQKQL